MPQITFLFRPFLLFSLVCFGISGLLSASELDSFGLPRIGPWMLTTEGVPARWLGVKFQGKLLLEPVNVVIVDSHSRSSDEAIGKFLAEATQNGFGEQWGHSTGYCAEIQGEVFPQLGEAEFAAFSDGLTIQENNHGRVFGPYQQGARWIFVAAMSRETFDPLASMPHGFSSFNAARDQFANRLAEGSVYRVSGMAHADNHLDQEGVTTGDHDGSLVILEAIR